MFNSIESIYNYTFRYRSEVVQAMNDLDSMYSTGRIVKSQYDNAKKFLEDKLRSM